MEAYVLHGANDLRFEEVAKPVPGEGEVLLHVAAVGICGSDIPRIYQTGAHKHPLIPGHEFSGVVEEVGPGVDTGLVGKRCGIFPLIPCHECGPCKKHLYEMCRNYNYLGSRCDGGFAEYVSVPAANLLPLPDSVSLEEAAMLEPMAVSVHAIRRVIDISEPEALADTTVTVIGVGTIGLLLTVFLLDAGIRPENLLLVGNKDFQRKMALKAGVLPENFCDSRSLDADKWLTDKTDGIGTDVTFDCVGRNETMRQAVDHAAPAGRVMLLGNPYSDMSLPRDIYWKILRNQLRVTGTWNSTFTGDENDDWRYVLSRLSAGKVHPAEYITQQYELKNLMHGFELMRDKSEDYVKVMGVNRF